MAGLSLFDLVYTLYALYILISNICRKRNQSRTSPFETHSALPIYSYFFHFFHAFINRRWVNDDHICTIANYHQQKPTSLIPSSNYVRQPKCIRKSRSLRRLYSRDSNRLRSRHLNPGSFHLPKNDPRVSWT